MVVLTLKNISKSFGAEAVLSDVSLVLTDEMRIGLVGPNGAGKTTLLRIINGEMDSDGGSVMIPSGTGAGYLQQEPAVGTGITVWETMLAVFDEAFALEERMRALEHAMEDAANDDNEWRRISREYENVTQAFEEAGGYGYKSAIGGVLKGLGLQEDIYDRAVSTLSGGQRSRLMLARLLLEKPGLLMLDEPTNHLDMDAVSWLETYLKTWQGAVVIVSHDRWFLDQICTHTAELHNGTIDVYNGNYTAYIAQREEKRRLQEKAYEHNQREISRQKKVIEQYEKWGRIGGGKNFIKARARENLLNKMERVERVENDKDKMSLKLTASGRGGNDVLMVEDLSMAYDVPLFTGLNIHMQKGDRAALVGANGVGKTTLLHIIADKLRPVSGEVTLGTGVELSYYDQLQENLTKSRTVVEEMRETFPHMTDKDIRNALAAFLFYGDDAFKLISTLSGGEKGRLSLLKLMLGKGNLLLLDEPTNHLDMDSREMLEEALLDYDGTVLFVSHDRYFINKVATRVLEMKPETVAQYDGNWSDYIAFLEKQRISPDLPMEDDGLTRTAAAKQKRAEKEKEKQLLEGKKRVKQLEEDIAKAERRLGEIEALLADSASLGETELVSLSNEYESVGRQIEQLMEDWEEAQEMV